jgi:cyanophycin synthetase
VLAHKEVELAVTETARGGILLKGIGLVHNHVSVVTNVSADHLGLQGIDTLDQLAEVKSVVPRITRADGWAVLNAHDPRVLAMRAVIRARPWVFTRDPDSPAVREVLADGGRATTVIDG